MDNTAAERKRRSRRHKRGDHSSCLPQRCRERAREVTARAAQRPGGVVNDGAMPHRAGSRGDMLRRGLSATTDASPAAPVLIEEAGRIRDRLDRLAGQLDGRAWLQMRTEDIAAGMNAQTVNVRVVIDAALSESRQQALALKGILAEVGRQGDEKNEPE